jgi:hypothetical protein
MFIKTGDGQITKILEEKELTEEQKKTVKDKKDKEKSEK